MWNDNYKRVRVKRKKKKEVKVKGKEEDVLGSKFFIDFFFFFWKFYSFI
jgi:hypothetical protein